MPPLSVKGRSAKVSNCSLRWREFRGTNIPPPSPKPRVVDQAPTRRIWCGRREWQLRRGLQVRREPALVDTKSSRGGHARRAPGRSSPLPGVQMNLVLTKRVARLRSTIAPIPRSTDTPQRATIGMRNLAGPSDEPVLLPGLRVRASVSPWDGPSASDEICPSCGLHFGYDDAAGGDLAKRAMIYRQWRARWLANGMPWSSRGEPAPPDWAPRTQVARVAVV